MMEGLCEVRLKKQGHLSIEKLVLVCGRAVIQCESEMLACMLIIGC